MRKILSSKTSNLLKYRYLPWLQGKVNYLSNISYSNLGLNINGKSAPKALLLLPTQSFDFYVQNRYDEGLNAKMHNIYFQCLVILKNLIDHGYVVDCVEKDSFNTDHDTSQYQIILDEGNTLAYLPNHTYQKKIFYCTGLKWERWNENELRRIDWFLQEYNIHLKPVRQLKPIASDKVADYILFKGVPEQMRDFSENAALVQLAMPVEYEPVNIIRDFSKREFVWIGGWGAIHKGLDLVVDAFEKMPALKLHIFGAIEKEKEVYKWLQNKLKSCKNIIYHGYADYSTKSFQNIIVNCVGHVYPSAGENGCATLAQTAHYGLLPITTGTANNQASYLGYHIEESNRRLMIEDLQSCVEEIALMDEKNLKEQAHGIMNLAKSRFTRSAFLTSFDEFLIAKNLTIKKG